MKYIKNIDGTYRGWTTQDMIDEFGNIIKDVKVTLYRIKVNRWVDDIEFSTPENYELLCDVDETIFNMEYDTEYVGATE